jgi:regulator of nucleoside diphosphate kinase
MPREVAMIVEKTVVVTDADLTRLEVMLRSLHGVGDPYGAHVRELREHVRQATLVPAREVEPDVVTMNSRVRTRDLESGRIATFTLVYHGDAGTFDERLSVLSPLGIRALGSRVGDVLEWQVPRGVRRLMIEQILYQPETEKAFEL